MKKAFGWSQTVCYLGSFLVFSAGISTFSLIQVFLNFLKLLVPPKNHRNAIPEIRNLGTKNTFHVLSEKLYHLKKDLADFIKMSSIHGVRNLAGGVGEKIFWLASIAVTSTVLAHCVSDLLEIFPQNTVIFEYDDKLYNVNEVFQLLFLIIPKRNQVTFRFRFQL